VGSPEALVFSSLFGSREILQHAWFARKLVANQVGCCSVIVRAYYLIVYISEKEQVPV
jgi:hypothetical protein